MKPYQIKGEIFRHITKLFSQKIHSYPALGEQGNKRICFLHPRGKLASSGFLRSKQLYDIASRKLAAYCIDDVDHIQDYSIVIGTKGTLNELNEAIRKKKQTNVLYFYDPVDELLDTSQLFIPDGLIASSYRQYLWLRSLSEKPVFLIPHHADIRITQQVSTDAPMRFAYFGSENNGYFTSEIKRIVEVFETSNHISTHWMTSLSQYPVHYCIRRKPEKSHSYKPATKLFIAAKVGAAVITTRDESDAELLLPPDYPFYSHDRSNKAILEVLDFAKSSFGTPVFAKARSDIANIHGWREDELIQQLILILNLT